MFVFNGFCVPDDTIMLTLTENSQNLMNTINFENNQQYYFASKHYNCDIFFAYVMLLYVGIRILYKCTLSHL